MHHKKIIFLFFQYFHLIFSYYGKLNIISECYQIDNIYIDGTQKFSGYLNEYVDENFSSGTEITIKLNNDIVSNDCCNNLIIYGYLIYKINENEESAPVGILWTIKNNIDTSLVIITKEINHIDCPYYSYGNIICDKINNDDEIFFIGYTPFICETYENNIIYLNEGKNEDINFKNYLYYNKEDVYEIFDLTLDIPNIVYIKVNDKFIEDYNSNIFNSEQTFTFVGSRKGKTTLSFSARVNEIHDYSKTDPPCYITFIVCWPGCKKCLGENTNDPNFQYCLVCDNDYALLIIDKTDDDKEFGNCYHISNIPQNYYIVEKNVLNSESDGPFLILKKCGQILFFM